MHGSLDGVYPNIRQFMGFKISCGVLRRKFELCHFCATSKNEGIRRVDWRGVLHGGRSPKSRSSLHKLHLLVETCQRARERLHALCAPASPPCVPKNAPRVPTGKLHIQVLYHTHVGWLRRNHPVQRIRDALLHWCVLRS